MKRTLPVVLGILVLALSAGCVTYQSPPPVAYGGSPRIAIVQPSNMYYLPRYRVYYVPDIPDEIFYYEGYWYYRSTSIWYMGTTYNGPWSRVEIRIVPGILASLPRDYRNPGFPHERVPYGHWERRDRDEGRDGPQGRSYIDAVRDSQRRAEPEPPPSARRDDRQPPGWGQDSDRPGKGRPRSLPRTPFPRPPRVRYIQAYSIYYVPGISIEIVFFDGSWYQRHEGGWYRGDDYDGPWTLLEDRERERSLDRLPPRYREERYEDVPYGHWERRDRDRGEARPGAEGRSSYVDAVKDARERESDRGSAKDALFPRERSLSDTVKDARDREQPPTEPPAGRRPEPPREREADRGQERDREERRPEVKPPALERPEPPGRTEGERPRPAPPETPKAAPGQADSIGRLKIVKPKTVSYLPGLGVYYIPGIDEEIFYYGGSWYLREQNAWYAGKDHDGPWKLADQGQLPAAIRGLPGQYRTQPTQTVPYGAWEDKGKGKRK